MKQLLGRQTVCPLELYVHAPQPAGQAAKFRSNSTVRLIPISPVSRPYQHQSLPSERVEKNNNRSQFCVVAKFWCDDTSLLAYSWSVNECLQTDWSLCLMVYVGWMIGSMITVFLAISRKRVAKPFRLSCYGPSTPGNSKRHLWRGGQGRGGEENFWGSWSVLNNFQPVTRTLFSSPAVLSGNN